MICYFSAGTYADYRDDEASFPRSALGLPLEFSGGEWWININDEVIYGSDRSNLRCVRDFSVCIQ